MSFEIYEFSYTLGILVGQVDGLPKFQLMVASNTPWLPVMLQGHNDSLLFRLFQQVISSFTNNVLCNFQFPVLSSYISPLLLFCLHNSVD